MRGPAPYRRWTRFRFLARHVVDRGPRADAMGVQGSLGHPAGNYARVVEAVRSDLESSGTPAFVTAIVTPGWEVRAAPVVFAALAPCRAQAQALAQRLGPGEMVLLVCRRVDGDRQTYTVLSPDALSTIYRRQEVAEPGRRAAA